MKPTYLRATYDDIHDSDIPCLQRLPKNICWFEAARGYLEHNAGFKINENPYHTNVEKMSWRYGFRQAKEGK